MSSDQSADDLLDAVRTDDRAREVAALGKPVEECTAADFGRLAEFAEAEGIRIEAVNDQLEALLRDPTVKRTRS
ncbi:hypothetical protein [Frankia sp. Cr1]|uniref:hypothetical protein n=1 Tax=Frankia sp. Cr1 TaxID=3073931 RepID=UPI002AD237D2|nr:hypothetical protein [Frankia sp. Cr1]